MRTPLVPAVLAFVLCGGATIEGQPPTRLTLDDAIARGLEASNRLAAIDARRDAAAASGRAEDAEGRPRVVLQAGYSRTNQVPEFIIPVATGQAIVLHPDIPDNLRTRIDLQWPIYTGGRVEALGRAARAEVEALGGDKEAARADLRLEIAQSYWAVVMAGASVRALTESLERVEAHLRDARNRLQEGLVQRTDVLSTEAQRSRQQVLLLEARNMGSAAAADLRRLTGLAPDEAIEVEPAPSLPPPPAAIDHLVARALAHRPERHALDRRVAAAGHAHAAASAGHLPSVVASGGSQYARPNPMYFPRTSSWNWSWDVTVNVSWSIWDGGRAAARMAQALANRREVEAARREFTAALDAEVRVRRFELETARAGVTAAQDGERSAAEAHRVLSQRYAAGVATNAEVLDAQVALVQAELDLTRAQVSAQLAYARLKRALGE